MNTPTFATVTSHTTPVENQQQPPSVCNLWSTPTLPISDPQSLGSEQKRDSAIQQLQEFLESGVLLEDDVRARVIALQASQFALVNDVMFYINSKMHNKRVVMPSHLRQAIICKTHSGKYSDHFSGRRL